MVEAIVRYRQGADQQAGTSDDQPFRTLAALAALPAIGQAGVARLTPWLTVTPSAFRFVATGRVRSHTGRRSQRLAILERTAHAMTLRAWRPVDEARTRGN